MIMDFHQKRLIFTSVLSILLVSILLIGSTYSIFNSTDIDEEKNVYKTANLDITYTLDNGNVILDNPNKCLIVEPEDWHTMDNFSKDAVLLVLASEYYDASDYIDKPYSNQ